MVTPNPCLASPITLRVTRPDSDDGAACTVLGRRIAAVASAERERNSRRSNSLFETIFIRSFVCRTIVCNLRLGRRRHRGIRLETGSPLSLFAEGFVALRVHEGAGFLHLLRGFGSQAQMRIDVTQPVVRRLELRIQLDDVFKRSTGQRPILFGYVEFAEFIKRIE